MGRITEAVEQQAELVQAQQEGTLTLRTDIERREADFAAALPAHVDPKRFVRAALSALNTVPRIRECAPATIINALMQAAQLGLEVSDVRGQAFIIPRKNRRKNRMEAVFQLGYRGMIDLAARNGITVDVDTIREGDEYDYQRGTEPFLRHKPAMGKPGAAIAYYSVAHFKDARQPRFVIWSLERVEEHRNLFASTRDQQGRIYGPWVDAFDGMAAKTVIRDLLDTMPLAVEYRDVLFRDDAEAGIVTPTAGQQAELDADDDIVDAEIVELGAVGGEENPGADPT